ncbi:helix-turn-helix transcriptional regulator [Phenylobacterium sp.]|uniref:helix-turn-helix transcriptional regulator n=1 Tax=Phenylobacterium sp. TaxID=1871053 RepID=UPI0035B29CE3
MSPAEAATLKFFQEAAQASNLEALVESFGECVTAHGFHRATLVRLATPGQPVQPKLLFHWHATGWTERYASEKLYRIDPTIQAVFSAVEPFSLDEVEARTGARDRAGVFGGLFATGVSNALIVPVHGPLGEVLAVTLASETLAEFAPDLRQRMHVAASLFATCGLTLIEREEEPVAPGLTRREIQCVYWVAEGKSDWEIGRILGISEETVAWHVQNAKKKLGVSRRAQMSGAAWRRGLLLDESND